MTEASKLLEKAAELRDLARRALRLAAGRRDDDRARLTKYSEELRTQAAELERQAAAVTPPRPSEPGGSDGSDIENGQGKKKRGGSNDPDPQT